MDVQINVDDRAREHLPSTLSSRPTREMEEKKMEAAALRFMYAMSSSVSSFVLTGVASVANAIYQVLRRWLLWTVATGPIPNHVAIIMDGSRRYAARRERDKRSGHEFGFDTLVQTLPLWYELGVKCISVYAFSIENFKRSDEEVTALMNVLQEKFLKLVAEGSVVRTYGVRLQILGELSLLPERVRKAAEEAMAATRDNDKAVLNIFAPYTSTREIVRAVENVCHEVITQRKLRVYKNYEFGNSGVHQHDDDGAVGEEIDSLESLIRAEEIERHLYTANCGEPELLIRTSGETRLSNFLLWQSSFAFLYVTPVLWPDFTFRHLLMAILRYQKAYPYLQLKKSQLRKLVSHTNSN